MLSLTERRQPFAVCTVVQADGSVPGKVGATMIVLPSGQAKGTVGGAGLEEKTKKLALEALRTGQSGLHHFDLANWKSGGLNSVCGGSVDIAIQVHRPVPHLLVYGGGHCGKALADIAAVLDWDVTVVDARPEFANSERFPHAVATHATDPASWTRTASLSDYSHAYLLGHSHETDTNTLAALVPRFSGFIGVIGSEAKRRSMFDRVRKQGVEPALLERVVCPIGVDIDAETPEEIAVAVAGELIATLKRTQRAPLEAPA